MESTQATIPLNEVKVGSRMRKDLGNIQGLADSIQRIGLIQPIVIDHEHNLIAGERRFRAHELLGLERIPFIYREQLPEDVRAELEFEENFWRKAFSWQEEALGILRIYRQKRQRAALEGWSGAYQQIVAEMFGMSIGNVNYVLAVAKRLENEQALPMDKRKYWNYQSASEAYRMGILGEEADRLNRDLAEQAKRQVNTAEQRAEIVREIAHIEEVEASPDFLKYERERYASNPLNKIPFDEYWAEKQARVSAARNTIHISNNFHSGDCIKFMMDPDQAGRFDHILTDPPYAINIEYLNQNNEHGGLQDLDRLAAQHQVCDNIELLKAFWPAAWRCTKDNAFVVAWCDSMLFSWMVEQAETAGFNVQRWPFIWRKINQSVMNQCAGYNTTKDYEFVVIARKPSATLVQKRNSSIIEASNVQATKETGHPFAKPYETTSCLLDLFSIKGQSVLDPFMGGGSIIIQGLRSERNMFGCELPEPEAPWFNQAMTNIKNLHYLKLNPEYVFS